MEYVHDAVDYFLGETHASPVNSGCDLTKIDEGKGFGGSDGGLGLDEDDFWFSEERFTPLAKCADWEMGLEIWTNSRGQNDTHGIYPLWITVDTMKAV